jgi:PBP1b-binding outer membrane lipoprotein LpoB
MKRRFVILLPLLLLAGCSRYETIPTDSGKTTDESRCVLLQRTDYGVKDKTTTIGTYCKDDVKP